MTPRQEIFQKLRADDSHRKVWDKIIAIVDENIPTRSNRIPIWQALAEHEEAIIDVAYNHGLQKAVDQEVQKRIEALVTAEMKDREMDRKTQEDCKDM